MAMNDFMYDPMAVRQQAAQQAPDPMVVGQQPMATVQSKMGLVTNPFASMPQNPAVYNNASAITTGMAMYGSPEMRQNSVAYMTQAQEDAFGPESEVYESGNTKIYNGLKNQ